MSVDREHLHMRLAAALDYGRASVEALVGVDPATGRERPESRKVLSETAVLLLVAARADDGRHGPAIAELAERLVAPGRSAAVRLAVAASPSRAPWLGLAHAVLTKLGFPDPQFDNLLRQTLASPTAEACEREPHRILDARWMRSLLTGGVVSHADVAPFGVLGKGLDLLTGSTNDGYALTHALFYATDFGRLPLDPVRSLDDILDDVEGAVAVALDADDLDLTAELLMAPAILRSAWRPVLSLAWHVLDGIWEDAGVVPSPGLDVAGYRAAQGAERTRIVLRDTYHTMCAAGLLYGTLLATDRAPPARAPSTPEPDATRWLRTLQDEQPRAWLDVVSEFPADRRAGAHALALDVAARRRGLAGDLPGLAEVLEAAVESGYGGRRLVEQTADFVARLLDLHEAAPDRAATALG